MKILFVFLIAAGAALGADLLLGKWKEDGNKRKNLSKFLKARGKFFPLRWQFSLSLLVKKGHK